MDYAKLVRDRIPDIIREKGKTPYVHTAVGSELERALWEKLDEEVAEFQESKDPSEIADVLEVVYAISAFYGIDVHAVEELRKKKKEERGGFEKGIILDKIE
jgi:predicted house-cleaning noncanonical NTP pyrophosphatase (MazG superfamily)